ncbi:glycogenin-1-like isoform X3 [Daphnia pulex]|uniref:glycogenin-1-like isoform X3 n=1 Tax=Daphnia pulex TaxID=6669 RepID=UPI001EDE0EDD|nr:glycogenin-1-like isoform X3 [Daphnia pulex]
MAAEAWVTLATNDSYAVGALVLAHSLKSANTTRPLVVMITDQVSTAMRDRLGAVSCLVQEVNVMDSHDSAHLALLARPELGITFTKLHCWALTAFSKCVFLDADTLVIQNCDELFEREEFSAAADAGWPDCFNSGVFVFRPSLETYSKLLSFAVSEGSFDGGDQGLLNSYFADWATKDISRRLPFIYNMTASGSYSYRPAYKQFGKNVRIVHFIGSPKPWQASEASAFQRPVPGDHIGLWWSIFVSHVLPCLSSEMLSLPTIVPAEDSTGVAAQFSQLVVKDERQQVVSKEEQHHSQPQGSPQHVAVATGGEAAAAAVSSAPSSREAWEQGCVDYTGRDSFDKIMEKIAKTLESQQKP